MKIHRVVTMLGATTNTGKLASDMYDLNDKTYYSEAEGRDIPISHMDFQHMVRAFVKLSAQAQEKPRDYTLEEVRKEKDEALDEGVSLANQVENLKELLKEKEELLEKEIISKDNWRNAYYDDCSTRGSRYIFTEIPNNEYGKKLTRGMKVYLNDESYTMRVRGQHIKPELKGTGATYWGQSIEQSTHLRVYIDKK
tara:strand:+ start:84 stop:671 length:588 start_codon:yes stop_codon:yes gene_type:complete